MQDLIIKRLSLEDSVPLSKMLAGDGPEYGRYFTPFDCDSESLGASLKCAKNDRYWGIWLGNDLAGFFMLRGFDEGYSRPSFGVYVARLYSSRGLSRLALDYAVSWCRLNGVFEMMLKVHPENEHAKHTYENAGFRFVKVCTHTGHYIMEKKWD